MGVTSVALCTLTTVTLASPLMQANGSPWTATHGSRPFYIGSSHKGV